MKIKQTIGTLTALAWLAAVSTTFTACSNDLEANSTEQSASEEITVAPYPSYTAETRAVDGAPKEKDAWENGDIIYIQVNGGDWTYIKYTDDGWNTDNVSISKGDSYKAVYAPNYEIVNGDLVLTTDEDGNTAIGSTGEYLVNTGVSLPIDIEFTRPYSRLRIYLGKSSTEENSADAASANATTNPIELTFGEGFTTNDGTEPGTIQLVPDEEGNAYVYGSWKDGTKLEITSNIQGNPTDNAVYVAKSISDNIAGKSVEGTSYAVDYANAETWVIDNLDHANAAAISDWTAYTDAGYTNIKVLGKWDEDKAPIFYTNEVDFSADFPEPIITIAEFTHIDLSNVKGLTKIGYGYFTDDSYVKNIELPEGLLEIDLLAFKGCSNLVMKKLPNTVTSIGTFAFDSCPVLDMEELPDALKTISEGAFSGSSIRFHSFPSQIETVGNEVFWGSTFKGDKGAYFEWPKKINPISEGAFVRSDIETFVIPEGITELKDRIFGYCDSLKDIICYATKCPTISTNSEEGTFHDTPTSQMTLYVPKASIESYQDSDWAQYFSSIKSIEDDLPNDYK
jgi:hypothetical protein